MIEPLTPAGLDLREFEWMPLDVMRLRDSDLAVLATGEAFRAAVLLWCSAWHQVPAGSLPSDDRLLANLAGYGRDLDGWLAVKSDAMRGFVECSDGRFYHPIVCQKAIEANEQRNKQRKRTEAATLARRSVQRNDARNDQSKDARNDDHHTSPNHTSPKVNRTTAKTQSATNEDFENFKRDYPRRTGGYAWKAAERKYLALVKTGVEPKMIASALGRFAEEMRKLNRIGTEYIPMPATWLNSEDFLEAAVATFEPKIPEKISLEDAVRLYAKSQIWSRHAPVSDISRAPPELLAKHGLAPDGRKLA